MRNSLQMGRIILLIVALFFFVFQTVVNKYVYIAIELLLVVLFYKSTIKTFINVFRTELALCLLIFLYSLLLDLFQFNIVYSDRFFAAFFQGYIVSILLSSWILNNEKTNKHFETLLIVLAAIASTITILCILNPSIDSIIVKFNDTADTIIERYSSMTVRHRGYGLSENLTFTYPYVLSVIGYYIITERPSIVNIVVLVMIVITIMFNARTAFFPVLFAIPVALFKHSRDFGYLFRVFFFSFVFVFLIERLFAEYDILNNAWAFTFFDEISDQMTGGSSDTISSLGGEMFVLPDDNIVTLLFGTGKSIFGAAGKHSDVGWILQLYYGGFLLFFLIVAYLFYITRRVAISLHFSHWFTFVFIISLVILNTKGFFFASTPGCRFLTFLYVYYIIKRRRFVTQPKIGFKQAVISKRNRIKEC